jgi:hypothetical protein
MSDQKIQYQNIYGTWITLCLALLLLSACTPPGQPIKITYLSISPDTIVGRVAKLHVEIKSTRDEPDTRIEITLPAEVNLVTGALTWKGALIANRPQACELSICVLREGEWKIFIGAISQLSPSSSYSDLEILNIRSTVRSAEVIPGSKYRVLIPQFGFYDTPTPAPVTVSPECSGNTK